MPNSSPTSSADLPLLSQFWTASSLKVWSNLRRVWADVVLMDLIIHDLGRFSVRQIEATSQSPLFVVKPLRFVSFVRFCAILQFPARYDRALACGHESVTLI